MNDNSYSRDEIEAQWGERLRAAAAGIQPRKAFAERLEADLIGRWGRAAQTRQAGPSRVDVRFRWAAAAVSLLLVAVVVIGILGPQRVWADLLHLLGYVPDVGFVDLDETRVLLAPVEVTREGITLRVEQVLAGSDRTTIVIESVGLPEIDLTKEQAVQTQDAFAPELYLPDGGMLIPITFTLHPGGGTFKFPPLPEDVYRVTLRLSGLPLVPAGQAPQNWMVPLTLRPATGELVAEMFPQPYAPEGASDTHRGVTLRVLAAAHSPRETALRLQLQWSDPDWETHFIHGDELPELRDNLGHVYQEVVVSGRGNIDRSIVVAVPERAEAASTPAVPALEQTMIFAPVSPAVQQITLTLDGVRLGIPAQASFAVSLGAAPQVGDTWPLDVWLQIADFPVHVTGAHLIEEQLGSGENAWQRKVLIFEFDPVPDRGDLSLRGIDLESAVTGFRQGGTGGYTPSTRQVRAGLVVEEGAAIPSGTILVTIQRATVLIHGPFVITWAAPGVGGTGAVEK